MKQLFNAVLIAAMLCACATRPMERPIGLLGDPAPTASATKTIVIEPGTKWVNVTGGDIVNFVVGEKSFAWAFNVARGVSSFELNRVAPPNMLDHRVDAYVAPDPRYLGGDGNERDSN